MLPSLNLGVSHDLDQSKGGSPTNKASIAFPNQNDSINEVPSILQKKDSIQEDSKKQAKKSLTTAHSPKNHRRTGGFEEKSQSQSPVLFFKKGDNFAYQNIAISPHYHMVVEEDHALHPRISILPNKVH